MINSWLHLSQTRYLILVNSYKLAVLVSNFLLFRKSSKEIWPELSFLVSNLGLESSAISFSVWPEHHHYAIKELFFSVENNELFLGDLNSDNLVNILDVVILVNMIIGSENQTENGDINQDNEINVLDIVLLVNLILGG